MKKILCSAFLGTAVGAIGLVACDASPPPKPAIEGPVAPEAIPPAETLVDVVRPSLADIVRDKDSYSQARRLGTLLPTLGPTAVPAVKATLNDLTVDLRGTPLELLVRFWATYEPEPAARWAKRESPLNYRPAAIFAALSTWAQMDPKQAIAVTWDWSDTPGLESIVPIALVRGWYAQGDPPELRQYLRQIPADILGQRALAAYIRAVVETQGSEAVKTWAESVPAVNADDKSYKLVVFSRVVDILSQIDVAAAIKWCERHCNGPYGANMRNLIGRNWALYDGPAAMAWLSTAPPGTDRDLSVRLTWAQWSRTDRAAAMAWMAASEGAGEPPPWLAPAFPVYARLRSGEDPRDALRWAARIQDPKERKYVTIGVLRVWRTMDEAAAEKWMADSLLPEETREKARKPPEPQPPSEA